MTAGEHRLSSEQRRAQVLAAARRVVAEHGFAATTEQVARAAGVSQPYVVRLFGSKSALLAAVHAEAAELIVRTFAETPVPPGADPAQVLGIAYEQLLVDRDRLLIVMHGFIASGDERIGAMSRRTLGEAFRLFRERAGSDVDQARDLVAFGMLLNVLVSVRGPEHVGEDEQFDALLRAAFCPVGSGAIGNLPVSSAACPADLAP